MTRRRRHRWSAAELAEVRARRENGESWAEIAADFGVTLPAAMNAIRPKPLPKFGPRVSTRSCLRCEQTFASAGPGNRLCPPCREFAARAIPAAEGWPATSWSGETLR